MMRGLITTIVALALLSGCGDDSGGDIRGTSPTRSPGGDLSVAGCTLRDRQDWVASELRQWYLFPDTLPASLDPTPYATVSDYLNALTATARSQRRDRYFTYLTSIASENGYYDTGASAGFGIRLSVDTARSRLFVAEAFEGAPALAAGIDRGTEIVAIGTSASDMRSVSSIIAQSGSAGLTQALGPDTAGTARTLQLADAAGTRTVTISKAAFALAPVSPRYGATIIDDGEQRIGYVNLRTFITTAEPVLRQAFAMFQGAGVTRIIVDLRYNGGGLISTAELMGDLLGGGRARSDVLDTLTYRPEKSGSDTIRRFKLQPEAVAATKIAFIGTAGTASASELVINAFTPYLHADAGLIGANTYGKPVGQIALDNTACDDRLRVIAFAVRNAAGQGDYYDGLAGNAEASCQAGDDLSYPLGDPRESSTRAALDFIEGKSCTPIAGAHGATALHATQRAALPTSLPAPQVLLTPDQPDTPQREVPGLF